LREAQSLLSHVIPDGDIAQVLHRALEVLVADLQRKKLGSKSGRVGKNRAPAQGSGDPQENGEAQGNADSQPNADSRRGSSDTHDRRRYIPPQVRRAVWERDQGQCTFVSTAGHRCPARHFLEFDHIQPVARGGKPTVEGLRLRCRVHNQLEAERAFGANFMRKKRRQARLAAHQARAERENESGSEQKARAERDAESGSGETALGSAESGSGETALGSGALDNSANAAAFDSLAGDWAEPM